MSPLLGARLTETLRDDVIAQLGSMLQHAGQYGIALNERAESLLGYSLLTESVTPGLPPALHDDRHAVPGPGGDGVVPEDPKGAGEARRGGGGGGDGGGEDGLRGDAKGLALEPRDEGKFWTKLTVSNGGVRDRANTEA